MLIIELPCYIQKNYYPGRAVPAIIDIDFFTQAAKTFFAYTCQVQLLPIYSELVNPIERRIKKVITVAILIDVLFYLVIAAAGYFSMYEKTNAIVLDRPSLNGTRDYAILVAVVGIIVVLFVAVPVNYNPFRN